MIKQLIFLDFDGVMTSVKNGTSFLCEKVENYHIDPEIQSRFNTLKDQYPDLKIVLISAWTKRGNLDDPAQFWPWKGLPMPTPMPAMHRWLVEKDMFAGTVDIRRRDENNERIVKFQRVESWLRDHENFIDENSRFIVLDDDDTDFNGLKKINSMTLPQGKIKYIKTNYEIGFSDDDFRETSRFFDS